MKIESYDTIIVGGGPAGAAAGALLASKGRQVVILERERFPRYIIGESMLPFCYFALERIGMIEPMKSSNFVRKYSVQFVRIDGRMTQPFYFFQHLDHEASTTWQVERSEFDAMLLDNARGSGVDVREAMTVKDFIMDADGAVIGVEARDADGAMHGFRAPVTIDASGQYTLSAARFGWRRMDRQLKKIAIWSYFKGAMHDPGRDAGATTVAYLNEKNWMWYIPLQRDIVSVGVVGERDYLYTDTRDPQTIFEREAEKNVWIREHLGPAERVNDFRVTGDFSYRSEYCAADGLVLTGDAFAFLDPVFSSGLFLALHGGVLIADAVDDAHKKNDFSGERFAEYGSQMCEAIEAMRKLIHAFYNPDFSFAAVLKEYPELRSDLTDCLIGNLHRDFTTLFQAISEFVPLPDPLPYGKPRVLSNPSVRHAVGG